MCCFAVVSHHFRIRTIHHPIKGSHITFNGTNVGSMMELEWFKIFKSWKISKQIFLPLIVTKNNTDLMFIFFLKHNERYYTNSLVYAALFYLNFNNFEKVTIPCLACTYYEISIRGKYEIRLLIIWLTQNSMMYYNFFWKSKALLAKELVYFFYSSLLEAQLLWFPK